MTTALAEPPDDEGLPVPVDPVDTGRTLYATVTGWRTEERAPILPAALRSRQEARDLAVYAARHGLHAAVFHGLRLPLYLARLGWYSPRGVWRSGRRVADYVFDGEGRPLRSHALDRKDVQTYQQLDRLRGQKIRNRAVPALVVAGVSTPVLLWLVLFGPVLAQLGAAVAAVAFLGKLGAPADRPLVPRAVTSAKYAPRVTGDIVVRGLKATGLSGLTAKDAVIGFVSPITRDGPGWLAELDLPHGVTAGDIMEKRAQLSSGLRRPVGCVWPEGVPSVHEGRLRLWVGDQDMAKARQAEWPLMRRGRVDLFEPFRFGTDQRGRPVTVCLMFANLIIGAVPRMGKTFALRLLLLAAALDAIAELHVFNLKGGSDFGPLEPVAHTYAVGDDAPQIRLAVATLQEIQADMRRRYKVLERLPRTICPESKVTRELAERRDLKLHPVVVAADECQCWFEHEQHGKALEALVTDLVKRGPAVGIIVMLATQRVDAHSIPKAISSNAILRFCLRVTGHTENDMVLGTSMYKAGWRATMFSRYDRGIGYLVGEGEDPQITRGHYVDAVQAEAVVERARAARETAGLLTGMAAGQMPSPVSAADLLEDMRVVFATCQVVKMWSEEMCERLAALRPDVYGDWAPAALAGALKRWQLEPGQVWRDGANRNGYTQEALLEAMGRRALEAGDDAAA